MSYASSRNIRVLESTNPRGAYYANSKKIRKSSNCHDRFAVVAVLLCGWRRLLLSDIADNRQLEPLALRGVDDANQPHDEKGDLY